MTQSPHQDRRPDVPGASRFHAPDDLRFSAPLKRVAPPALLAALLAACVSDTIPISMDEPQRVELPGTMPSLEPGSALEREHQRLIRSFGGEYRAPRLQALLGEIANRLRLVPTGPTRPTGYDPQFAHCQCFRAAQRLCLCHARVAGARE